MAIMCIGSIAFPDGSSAQPHPTADRDAKRDEYGVARASPFPELLDQMIRVYRFSATSGFGYNELAVTGDRATQGCEGSQTRYIAFGVPVPSTVPAPYGAGSVSTGCRPCYEDSVERASRVVVGGTSGSFVWSVPAGGRNAVNPRLARGGIEWGSRCVQGMGSKSLTESCSLFTRVVRVSPLPTACSQVGTGLYTD